jgi:beta-phosphoglucomutase family hydrolase
MTNKQPLAVLFDMDGVVVDNISYHFDAWRQFAGKYGFYLSDDELTRNVNGRVAREILEYLFRRELSPEEVHSYTEEKEDVYRELYRPHLKPAEGLVSFLQDLQLKRIPTAIATSAPYTNVSFTLDGTDTREFFGEIVDARHVRRGKPDPEIYLLAASRLGMPPEKCIVIEDALLGVQAGLNAGMKVIGVTTTHTPEELSNTHHIIRDFRDLKIEVLYRLLGTPY